MHDTYEQLLLGKAVRNLPKDQETISKESFFINCLNLARDKFHIMDYSKIRFIEPLFDLLIQGRN